MSSMNPPDGNDSPMEERNPTFETVRSPLDAEVAYPFDWESDEPLCVAIARAVASVANVPATELTPVYEQIDTEAVEALFGPTPSGEERTTLGVVTFVIDEHVVHVYSDGNIRVQPPVDF